MLLPKSDDTSLATTFLYSPEFYHRIWQVEKHLQKYDYMVRVSPLIKSAVYTKQESIDTLAHQQSQSAKLWQSVVEKWQKTDSPSSNVAQNDKEMIAKQLRYQSGYTAMKIVSFVSNYLNLTDDEKMLGKLCHEHSYHRVGEHFILVIYGHDEKSELHKNAIYQNHAVILQGFGEQLADKGVCQLFLVGFDLSSYDEQGNIQVLIDVYHQQINQM